MNSNQNRLKRSKNTKIIKKYNNRKLYDTEQSSYVVLKDIEKMIRNKEDIRVIDNETQADITTLTLTQIIFNSEKRSQCSTPINILQSIIREGDGGFSAFLQKMGFFTSDKLANNQQNSPQKKVSPILNNNSVFNFMTQNAEQKIETLINSNDALELENSENTIPNLPGNKLK